MSREILFRGFHKDENGKETIYLNGEEIKGKWVEGFYWTNGCDNYFIKQLYEEDNQYKKITLEDFEVIPETVGQYCGLDDKNGKKIFENDVVLIGEKRRKVEVIFLNGQFGYLYNNVCINFQYQSPEVIGTIFDKEVK